MADGSNRAVIELIAEDLMSSGFIAAGKSGADLAQKMDELSQASNKAGGESQKLLEQDLQLAITEKEAAAADKKLADEKKRLADEAKNLSDKFGEVQKGFLLIGGAAVTLVSAVLGLEYHFYATASAANKMAMMAGTTVESFSQLSGAADRFGVEAETIQHGMTLMSFRMREAINTGGELGGALGALGITTKDFTDTADGSTQVLIRLADQFSKMPDGPEKTAKAMEIFSRGGAELIPFLNRGGDAIKRQMEKWDELGLTTTKADVAMGRAIRSSVKEIEELGKAGESIIARALGPLVVATFESIGKVADTVFHSLVDEFGGVDGATKALTKTMLGMQPVVEGVVDAFRGAGFVALELGAGLALAAAGWYKLNAAAAWIVGNDDVSAGFQQAADDAADFAVKIDKTASALVNADLTTKEHTKATEKDTQAQRDNAAAMEGGAVAARQLSDARAALTAEIAKTKADISNAGALEALTLEKDRLKVELDRATAATQVAQAVIAADKSIVDEQIKYQADQMTRDKQLELSRMQSERAVYDEKVKFDALKQNSEQEVAKGVIAADESVEKARQAFEVDRKTVGQQLKQSQIDASKGVVDAQIKHDAQRLNSFKEMEKGITEAFTSVDTAQIALEIDRNSRDAQLAKLRINADKEVFDAETSLMAQRASADQSLAKSRIALESEIEGAQQKRAQNYTNASLISEKSIVDAATQTDSMRQTLHDRQMNRAETLKQAQIHAEEELQGKIEGNDALRAKIANDTQIKLEAHEDVETRILRKKLDKKKAEAEHNDELQRGLDVCDRVDTSTGRIAASTGAAASAASSFAGSMGAAASSATTLGEKIAAMNAPGSYSGAGAQTKFTFGSHTVDLTPDAATIARLKGSGPGWQAGSDWTNENQRRIDEARSFDEWDKQQAAIKAEADKRATSGAGRAPATGVSSVGMPPSDHATLAMHIGHAVAGALAASPVQAHMDGKMVSDLVGPHLTRASNRGAFQFNERGLVKV